MSTLGTPEIPDAFGALDSNAFADGQSFSSHLLREQVRSANHLMAKGQHLCALPYLLQQSTDEVLRDGNRVPAGIMWTRIMPTIYVPKKAGLTRGEVRINARIADDLTIKLAIGTRAAPFNPENVVDRNNILTMQGDGDSDVDAYGSSLDTPGVPLDDGDFEEIDLWVKAVMDDTTIEYSSSSASNTAVLTENSLFLADADWADSTWPGRGIVAFFDRDGELITTRQIFSVDNDLQTVRWVAPWLTASQWSAANDSILNSAGDAFLIVTTVPNIGGANNANFALSSFALAAKPRTT